MFQRFFEKQRLAHEERTRIKQAINVWRGGLPQGSLHVIRNVWPVKLWAELIEQKKIYLNNVDVEDDNDQLKIPLLGYIQNEHFWTVVSKSIQEDDPKWDMWMTTALQSGNVAFFKVFPKTWSEEQLYCACTHPVSKKWVEEHPVYGTIKNWRCAWPPLQYIVRFRNHLVDKLPPAELLDIVKLNYEFEDSETAGRAFDELLQVLEDRHDGFQDYKEVLRAMWTMTESSFPFDIVCTLHGKVPLIKDTSAEIYKDCTSVANYGQNAKLWTYSTAYTHHTESTPLEVSLQLMQPSSKEELIEILAAYYNNAPTQLEDVTWDASFSETQDTAMVK